MVLSYATLKRGDIITAVNDEVVLDLPFPEIETILFKAGMPVTLTVLSGRIDFTQRRARECVHCPCLWRGGQASPHTMVMALCVAGTTICLRPRSRSSTRLK